MIGARSFAAEEYERGRPGRPADAVAALVERFGARTVLDLAAGTGKLTEAIDVVRERKLEGAGEMRRDTVPWREALEAEPRLGPLRDEEVPHDLQTDRDGILAMVASWSAVGSLPGDRRAATLAAVRDVLERHRAGEATIRFKTLITSAERVDG